MFCMHQCTCEPFLRSDDELGKIFMFIFGIFALDFFYVKYDNRRTNMQHLSLAMASSYNFKPVIKKVTLFGKVFFNPLLFTLSRALPKNYCFDEIEFWLTTDTKKFHVLKWWHQLFQIWKVAIWQLWTTTQYFG